MDIKNECNVSPKVLRFYHVIRTSERKFWRQVIFRSLTGSPGINLGAVEEKLGVKSRELFFCTSS